MGSLLSDLVRKFPLKAFARKVRSQYQLLRNVNDGIFSYQDGGKPVVGEFQALAQPAQS